MLEVFYLISHAQYNFLPGLKIYKILIVNFYKYFVLIIEIYKFQGLLYIILGKEELLK
jgi:hypothetical protein